MFLPFRVFAIAALLPAAAVAQTPSSEPPAAEQTTVNCEAFQRTQDGEKWVVLAPTGIRIGGKSIELSNDSDVARGATFDGVDVAAALETICYGDNPREIKTNYWPRPPKRHRK